MPHHLDALDVVVRESTRLVSEQRQFLDGVRSTQEANAAAKAAEAAQARAARAAAKAAAPVAPAPAPAKGKVVIPCPLFPSVNRSHSP